MKKFIKIQVIQQSTFDLLDYEMIVNIDHIITIQEKAERESRFADLFAGLTPEPILVDHWFPDPEPEAPWDEEDDESDLMIINIQP